jgi:hypothetical protein
MAAQGHGCVGSHPCPLRIKMPLSFCAAGTSGRRYGMPMGERWSLNVALLRGRAWSRPCLENGRGWRGWERIVNVRCGERRELLVALYLLVLFESARTAVTVGVVLAGRSQRVVASKWLIGIGLAVLDAGKACGFAVIAQLYGCGVDASSLLKGWRELCGSWQ